MRDKSNIFGDLPKKPIKQKVEDNRLVERVESENLYPFKKGSFETYEDFRKRLTEAFQYDISIGTVRLSDKSYDVETKKFFLNIQYQKYFNQISILYIETANRFYIKIEPPEAQSLYYDYENYELIAQFQINCKHGITIQLDKKVNVGIKKIWLVAKAKSIVNHSGFKILVWDKKELDPYASVQDYFKNSNTLSNNLPFIEKKQKKLSELAKKEYKKIKRSKEELEKKKLEGKKQKTLNKQNFERRNILIMSYALNLYISLVVVALISVIGGMIFSEELLSFGGILLFILVWNSIFIFPYETDGLGVPYLLAFFWIHSKKDSWIEKNFNPSKLYKYFHNVNN